MSQGVRSLILTETLDTSLCQITMHHGVGCKLRRGCKVKIEDNVSSRTWYGHFPTSKLDSVA